MDGNEHPDAKKQYILVSPRQRGNPLIKHITNIDVVEGETHYDYKITEDTQVLFLSLRYHRMHRRYIASRIRHLRAHRIKNPFIICQIDIQEPQDFIDELTVTTFTLGYRLLLSWSPRESATILEILKLDGSKGLEYLNRKRENIHLQTVQEIIACVKSVNSTDAVAISKRFKTVKDMMHITADDLDSIHGLGKRKVQALLDAFSTEFF
ncbi:ercc1/rad10/swi10 like protein [Babesia gibsoni]|uniref:Ercc1/rad10/swi10 like protein n=1 Tax=Babesia gibsoni TaxID=33632 RepID=A0AAD8PEW2_BABGI|nr:ercc1/rad10/swi10 like protein [Babesia gibsoni]